MKVSIIHFFHEWSLHHIDDIYIMVDDFVKSMDSGLSVIFLTPSTISATTWVVYQRGWVAEKNIILFCSWVTKASRYICYKLYNIIILKETATCNGYRSNKEYTVIYPVMGACHIIHTYVGEITLTDTFSSMTKDFID